MTIEQMIARQQELLNAARSAGRNMTREEAAEFDSLQRSIDAARAAGAGIAHGGQSSTPAAPANNTPEGQRQQTPAAGEGGNGGQDPQNAQRAIEAVNPLYQYRDSIEVVEDPTINALCGGLGNVMPWFLIGDPGDTDFIEVDYLNGQEIPNIRRMEAPGQLGFIWDIYLDWGISVMDYRGAVKNPGIKVDTKLKLV